MTQDNERVRLAKEVIARLDAGTIVPATGKYLGERQDGDSANTCRVCAVASLAVACCGIDKLNEEITDDTDVDQDVTTLTRCLAPLFTEEQLGLIEAAYERSTGMPMGHHYVPDLSARRAAVDAFVNFQDHATRMRAIMQNIIANGGEFRP